MSAKSAIDVSIFLLSAEFMNLFISDTLRFSSCHWLIDFPSRQSRFSEKNLMCLHCSATSQTSNASQPSWVPFKFLLSYVLSPFFPIITLPECKNCVRNDRAPNKLHSLEWKISPLAWLKCASFSHPQHRKLLSPSVFCLPWWCEGQVPNVRSKC